MLLPLAALACSLPVTINLQGNPTATPLPLTATPSPAPTPQLGTQQNPLIFALAPSPHADPQVVAAGEEIAAFIEQRTGYRLVTVAPPSEASLVDAFDKGNAHIGILSPFGYLLARQNDSVAAILASAREGQIFYGAQFIASRESGFVPFFSEERAENTAEARDALRQFENKKPCWTDSNSPSGYVVPLGVLKASRVRLAEGAFLQGHPAVVRAVYAGDICDFGATYVDARSLPALEANYPDVFDRVRVIWRVPNIIPYENISMSNLLTLDVRRNIQRAFIDLLLSPDGKEKLQMVYGMDEIQAVDDTMYAEFEKLVQASGVNLADLIQSQEE